MQSEINSLRVQINEITSDEDYILDNKNQQLSPIYPDYLLNQLIKLIQQVYIETISLVQVGKKKAWQYIFDRFKIMNKIHELFDDKTRLNNNNNNNNKTVGTRIVRLKIAGDETVGTKIVRAKNHGRQRTVGKKKKNNNKTVDKNNGL
ncbi:hypothetical protein Glove_168g156 [Diversispora epigaea]|uniref:Uncharacterized protein n=1 Tax=Diversispora epigaea TaxID=1348612 RepID=A0A397IPM8_9GLOM|nr:hypothetical protein Glove_168g156 [Diversispora epigaea]